MSKNICPVCGYDRLERPIQDYDICPSCLCEFGISDRDWTYDEIREDWIAHGAQWAWGSNDIPKPYMWDNVEQLYNIGYICSASDLQKMGREKSIPSVHVYAPLRPTIIEQTSGLTVPYEREKQRFRPLVAA